MVEIKISDVLQMLQDGYTRNEIRDHYGLSGIDLKRLFQHPKLKGKRTRPKPAFTIVDDINGNDQEVTEEAISAEAEEISEIDSSFAVNINDIAERTSNQSEIEDDTQIERENNTGEESRPDSDNNLNSIFNNW